MGDGFGAPRFTLPARCPACGGEMEVARYHCPACDTSLEGHFAGCRFCLLDSDQRRLVEVLLQARGNLRDVERELCISYPTVRARLDAALAALGLAPSAAMPAEGQGSEGWQAPPPSGPGEAEDEAAAARKREVLEALDRGEIAVEEALRRLRRGGR
ncbi:MAG: DUF2089 domain-containing protein [Acetobacteraceae bacterium]|nr:DUF2089 domain-containing protein [Acetobacteraceae bacterium]